VRVARAIVLLAATAVPAAAADLTVTKAATVVSDTTAALKPRALPGATIDYRLTVTNPLTNATKTVRDVQLVDTIDPALALSLSDLGAAGSGPVELTDGAALGLFASGVTLAGIDYSKDGTTWTYQPKPVGGTDPLIRAIRIRLSGNQAAGGTFRLRYRTFVR
jgi:hypothetical protein